MTYIEQDCTFEHDGRSFTSGGAVVTPDYAIAYLCGDPGEMFVSDWHGKQLGSARVTASWRVNSYLSNRMHQVEATIDGITYTGRSLGVGMSWHGKPKAHRN